MEKSTQKIDLVGEAELGLGEDAPMTIAVNSKVCSALNSSSGSENSLTSLSFNHGLPCRMEQ